MCLQIINDKVGHSLARLDGGASNVRQQNHVFEREELLRDFGLVLVDIEPGPANASLEERRHELGLVHVGPPPDVDQNTIRTQSVEDLAVDDVPSLLRQRTRDHQDVAAARQLSDRRAVLVLDCPFLRPRVVSYGTLERLCSRRDRLPDPSQTNYSNCFATELKGKTMFGA